MIFRAREYIKFTKHERRVLIDEAREATREELVKLVEDLFLPNGVYEAGYTQGVHDALYELE